MYKIFTGVTIYETISNTKHLWIIKLLGDHKRFENDPNNWFVESNSVYGIPKVVLDIIEVSKSLE
jgi:hypothetical protein